MVFEPKKYQWRSGYNYKVKADIVGGVFEKIEDRDGSVTKEAFLDESRPKNSPTHSMFEWDNKVAAEKYRLEEARHIITALQIVYVNDEKELSVPAVINVTTTRSAKKAIYRNTVDALSEQESRDLIVERLRKEVEQLIERNRHIDELVNILQDAVERLKAV